jgi:hypothetical protein
LAQRAKQHGVKHIQAKIVQVERATNGDIAAVITDQQQRIAADWFVDCSGFAAILMQQQLGVKFSPYKSNLFNDSALVMPTPAQESIAVETTATALSHGWCWRIPLQNRTGNGYVYSSDFIDHDAAELQFRQYLGQVDNQQECRRLRMQVGCLDKQWHQNCVALGLTQGFIEPLEATALHLVQISIELFIEHFTAGNFTRSQQDKYNQQVAERYARVRDYIVAHYKLNTRPDSEYWRANRDNEQLSDSLIQLLEAWYRRDDLEQEIQRQNIGEHFSSISWHCLLAGYGAFPALAAKQPGQGDLYKEQNIAKFLQGCALNFQPHMQNLQYLSSTQG